MNYTSILILPFARPLAFGWKLNLKKAALIGALVIVFLTGFYIFQVNAITQASFNIANYDKDLANLQKELKNLQLNFSGLSSLSNLEVLLVSRGYEKVDKIQYIQVLESTVAQKPR